MHRLISLLPTEHSQRLHDIWQDLDEYCGLTGIRITPFPHFSWLTAKDFDWPALETIMQELAAEIPALIIRTNGLAFFTGRKPVAYIPVIRTLHISAIHQRIWERMQSIGKGIDEHYDPENWIPHISLAYADITRHSLSCLVERMGFHLYTWEIRIDNLALIYEPAGETGIIRYRFNLTGQS